MHVYMYVHVCKGARVWRCVCACVVGGRWQPSALSLGIPSTSFETTFHIDLKCINWAKLACKQTKGTSSLYLSSTEIIRCVIMPDFFIWVSGLNSGPPVCKASTLLTDHLPPDL